MISMDDGEGTKGTAECCPFVRSNNSIALSSKVAKKVRLLNVREGGIMSIIQGGYVDQKSAVQPPGPGLTIGR